MSRQKIFPPRIHVRAGSEKIRVDGKDYILGPEGSEKAKEEYARLIKILAANSGHFPARPSDDMSVDEALAEWLRFAKVFYEGKSELAQYPYPVRVLRELYGTSPVRQFGPVQLQVLLRSFAQKGWCRRVCNRHLVRIRTIFRWLESQGFVERYTFETLKTVRGLTSKEVRESPPILPVPQDVLDKTLPELSQVVRDMVQCQLLSGCRPGEILKLRKDDILQGRVQLPGGDVLDLEDTWAVILGEWKLAHLNRLRMIFFGPQAQEILARRMRFCSTYLFPPNYRTGGKGPSGLHYSIYSYRQAIVRACLRANVPPWCPLQLRHNAATLLRKTHGLEAAQNVLQHADPQTTLIYALNDLVSCVKILGKVG